MTPEKRAGIAARNAQITRIIHDQDRRREFLALNTKLTNDALKLDHNLRVMQHQKKTGKTRRPTTKALISFKTYSIEASSRAHPRPMRDIRQELFIRDSQSTVQGLIQFLRYVNLSSLEQLDNIEITVKLSRPFLEHNPHLRDI